MANPRKLNMMCGHYNCVYAQHLDGAYGFCAYILFEKSKRECSPDTDCKHFRRGRKKKIIDYESNTVRFEIEDIEGLDDIEELNEME